MDDVTIEGPREFLAKGASVTGLGGPKGSQTHFRISVPEGAYKLDFLTAGGTGDVDLRLADKGSAERLVELLEDTLADTLNQEGVPYFFLL